MASTNNFSSKIDVRRIIKEHWATIENANTGKPSIIDYFIFIGAPLLFASILLGFKALMVDAVVGNIITGLAVFVGLLFNVLVLIFTAIQKDNYNSIKNILLEQSLANISFSILIALLCIIAAVISLINILWIKQVSNFVVYSLLIEFIACLLMVLKRMYNLLYNEIRASSQTGIK